uniref:Photosystem I assembly protein Ycf4 n=1 Tax=Spermothamnion repens TaxID=31383 RepID=A0A4D6WY03_9FLOR|nr:photosystem I assembly protein Ycf4 [Spermothamnion repens]
MNNIKTDYITGSRRLSNYWWASIILIAGLGFFLTGLSSYLNKQLIPLYYTHYIKFLPQGLVMTFYGTLAIIVSLFLWYTIVLNIGGGYNEFDKNKGIITIFRFGFPGKNRILRLYYNTSDIQSIKLNIKEGISPKREICLKTKDKREIPITKIGEPIAFNQIELEASNLAKFLGVMLEGIENEVIK